MTQEPCVKAVFATGINEESYSDLPREHLFVNSDLSIKVTGIPPAREALISCGLLGYYLAAATNQPFIADIGSIICFFCFTGCFNQNPFWLTFVWDMCGYTITKSYEVNGNVKRQVWGCSFLYKVSSGLYFVKHVHILSISSKKHFVLSHYRLGAMFSRFSYLQLREIFVFYTLQSIQISG